MAVSIAREVVTCTSAPEVFGYLSDFRNVPGWLFGVTRFEPVTSRWAGTGASFDATVSLGLSVRSRIAVREWIDPRTISFESVKGFKNESRWEVTPLEGGGSRLSVALSYDLPFGPAGAALGRSIAPFLGAAVDRSAGELKKQLDLLSPSCG